jgi:pyruvate kinase
MDSHTDRDTALEQAEAHLKKRGIVQSGDVYAITCGEPMGAPGGTNMRPPWPSACSGNRSGVHCVRPS